MHPESGPPGWNISRGYSSGRQGSSEQFNSEIGGLFPKVVCAFNLNAAMTPIHHWSMVPSVASWCGIKPFPSEANVLIISERKDTASLIARECGIAVQKILRKDGPLSLNPLIPVIIKPRDLGGSVGLKRSTAGELAADEAIQPTDVIQEFVRGFDLTILWCGSQRWAGTDA